VLELGLSRGGSALVTATDGERVSLLSSAASPPGSTLELSLDGKNLRVKVRSCRRLSQADAAGRAFEIEGRWLSLSRSDRERILSSTAGRGDDEP
jgi:hypothetical protein